jgi:hypothetical protein
MGTFQRPNRFFLLVIVSLSTVLAACSSGGGGKGGPAPNTGDTRPEPFVLSAPASVDPAKVDFDTAVISEAVTVSGIDTAAPVSIEDGEFAIDSGEFGSEPSTIRNGQKIRVRVQSPVKAEQSATATLNIGGETASFTVTTDVDTVAPQVAILFPPPASMTEGATLFVRGTVKDLNGTLEEGAITVNGVDAEIELNAAGDEGIWHVTVDLEPGPNTLTVVAADIAENANDDKSVSSLRVASIDGQSFPDNLNPFRGPLNADIGILDGQQVAFVTDDTALAIFAVDLTSGQRIVVSDNSEENGDPFEYPWAVAYGADGFLYVSDSSSPALFKVDPESGVRSTIATAAASDLVRSPRGIALDDKNNPSTLYVADGNSIYSLDIDGGEPELLSSAAQSVPDNLNPIDAAFGLVTLSAPDRLIAIDSGSDKKVINVESGDGTRSVLVDTGFSALNAIALHPNGREVLVVDDILSEVSAIDVETKSRRVLSSAVAPDNVNAVSDPWGIATSAELGYALIVDPILRAVMAIDLDTGRRVVLSKSTEPSDE